MWANIVQRLLDVYSQLMNHNSLPMNLASLNEDSFNLETAFIMIAQCEKLIQDGEKQVLNNMDKMENELKNFLDTVRKFKTFDCKCDNAMMFIQLHSKARDGLQNKVPELEKNVENVAWQLRKTILSIHEAHRQPNDMEIKNEKRENVDELLDLFDETKVKYKGFEERFDRLYNYLEHKLKPNQSQLRHVSQAVKYLDGKSDVFLSFLEEEDNEFIKKDLGGSTPQIQEVLRNSLKEVMSRRGVTIDKSDMDDEIEIELTDEQESLLDRLDMFYTDVVNMEKGVKFLQTLVLSTSLQELQTFDFNVQELKMEIQLFEEENNL